MKYMVMECHLTYAVVLSEDGRFLKAANLHYEPGQVVTDLVEMEIPESRRDEKRKGRRWIYTLAAAAACLMLAATSMLQAGNRTYGSVYMTINPEVRIDVNRKDLVVDLEGINQDGLELIDGYSYRKKELDVVVDELVDRAIDQGYLHEGGRISLALEGEDGQWVMDHSDSLSTHLNEHLTGKMSVTIEVTDRNHESSQVMIPITPQADHYNEMDYGEDKETPEETEPVQTEPAPTESVSPETAPTENQETGVPAESSRAESVPAVTAPTEAVPAPTEPAPPEPAPTEPAPIQETQPPATLPETWPDDDDGQTDYEDSDDGQTDYGDRDDGQTDYGDDDDDDDGDDD